jgi:hypothetical protein
MSGDASRLWVESTGDGWVLAGSGYGVGLVNDFLEYLSSRNYSPRTVRAYAFDLLHFVRWLSAEQLALDAVEIDALLRYMSACRAAILPHQDAWDPSFRVRQPTRLTATGASFP